MSNPDEFKWNRFWLAVGASMLAPALLLVGMYGVRSVEAGTWLTSASLHVFVVVSLVLPTQAAVLYAYGKRGVARALVTGWLVGLVASPSACLALLFAALNEV